MILSHARESELWGNLKRTEADLQQQKTMNTHLDSTFHVTKKALVETQHQLTMQKGFNDDHDEQLHIISDLTDKLEFESKVSGMLQKKIADLQEHYKARETDWHALSVSWAEYEQQNAAEAHTVYMELAECKKTQLEEPHHAPMPVEEPEMRDATKMDFNVNIPQYQAHDQPQGPMGGGNMRNPEGRPGHRGGGGGQAQQPNRDPTDAATRAPRGAHDGGDYYAAARGPRGGQGGGQDQQPSRGSNDGAARAPRGTQDGGDYYEQGGGWRGNGYGKQAGAGAAWGAGQQQQQYQQQQRSVRN
eukprot:gene7884-1096_t